MLVSPMLVSSRARRVRNSALLAVCVALGAPLAAHADPIAPLPPTAHEGDVGAAVRAADAADAAAGHVHTDPHARSNGGSSGAKAATAKALALGAAAGKVAAAGALLAGPIATRALPARIDAQPSYVGQNSCDPIDKPGATAYAQLMKSTYGKGVAGISRWCNAGQTEHSEGRAIDWMLSAGKPEEKAVADAATAWLTANSGENARRLGVMYLIWNKKMWRAYAPERGWQPYTGASPHTDHIHTSLTWDGAMKRTSWWTGSSVTALDLGPCRPWAGSPALVYTSKRTASCPASAAAPSSSYPVVVPGERNANVAVAQRALGITADGQFGYGTRTAVLAYQQAKKLPRTGVLDKATWARLVPQSVQVPAPAPQPPATKDPKVTPPKLLPLPAKVTTRYTPLKNTRLALGSKGSAVSVLQTGLRVPATAVFDARTRTALIAFQKSWKLPTTGGTNLKTWNRLELRQFPWLAYQTTTVRRGQTGRVVVALQQALRITADGDFGGQTAAAVMTVQARYGLAANGVVDPTTWRAVTAQAPR